MYKILVTGGCGFIGTNFILKSIDKPEVEILNIDKLTYSSNRDSLLHLEDRDDYNFINGDIGDLDTVRDAFNEFNPDCIINFAAESHVDRSIDSPLDFINTNIVGTSVLLNATLEYYRGLEQKEKFIFIHVSTDEVYGSINEGESSCEDDPYFPNSPYSASKASSDYLVRAWNITYRLPAIITHCSNNFGSYQFPEKLIPLMVIKCLKEESLPIYGNGENIRDWIHVDDHCDALYMLSKNGKSGETYNIGGGNEFSNIFLVRKICEIMDKNHPRRNNQKYSDLILFVDDRPGHDFRYSINFEKIKNDIGWEPLDNFEQNLEQTVLWYLNNTDWWKKIINKEYDLKRLGLK